MTEILIIYVYYIFCAVYFQDVEGIRKNVNFERAKAEAGERMNQNILSLQQAYGTMKLKPVKNVILFVGDGMGVTVLTGARIYRSQKFENVSYQDPFEFEKFPFSGLSKTHSFDSHVSDSAAGATALLCGVKTINDLVSMNPQVPLGFVGQMEDGNSECLADHALRAGKSVGLVTTTRVTHATPASLYAHSPNRRWESDIEMIKHGGSLSTYKDIARQMVEDWPAKEFSVILGAGTKMFKPNCTSDPRSERQDGRNLIEDWILNYNYSRRFVSTVDQLKTVDYDNTDQLLGLFAPDHIDYVTNKDRKHQPTLSEMSLSALKMLSKNDDGYFLLIEGGRIDMALHENQARRSFEEVIAFDEAVKSVIKCVNLAETLIVVTADHSHNMNIIGFPSKTTSILGLVQANDSRIPIEDGLPSTIITFADGKHALDTLTRRSQLNSLNTEADDFHQLSMIPRKKASHGGDDVPVYATGPYSYIFRGLMENTDIAHYIMAATCIGPDRNMCIELTGGENARALSFRDFTVGNYVGTILTFLLSVGLFVSLFINVLLACKTRF